MADSVYTADLFGPPSRAALLVLASDKPRSRNYDGAGLPEPLTTYPHPLPSLADLDAVHDFAIEQHSHATRKAYRSDFALFALWCALPEALTPVLRRS